MRFWIYYTDRMGTPYKKRESFGKLGDAITQYSFLAEQNKHHRKVGMLNLVDTTTGRILISWNSSTTHCIADELLKMMAKHLDEEINYDTD